MKKNNDFWDMYGFTKIDNIIPFNIYDTDIILSDNENKLIVHNEISNTFTDPNAYEHKDKEFFSFNLHLYFTNEYKVEYNYFSDFDKLYNPFKLGYYKNRYRIDIFDKKKINLDDPDLDLKNKEKIQTLYQKKLLKDYIERKDFNNKIIYILQSPIEIKDDSSKDKLIWNKFIISKPNNIFLIENDENHLYIYHSDRKIFYYFEKKIYKTGIKDGTYYKMDIDNNTTEYVDFDENSEYYILINQKF